MTVIKSLWASVQGDPVFMRRVNGWLTIFWILMIPVSIMFGLLSSVAYVSALSLWALVSGWWNTAAWLLLFNVLHNGYPVLSVRQLRARLERPGRTA